MALKDYVPLLLLMTISNGGNANKPCLPCTCSKIMHEDCYYANCSYLNLTAIPPTLHRDICRLNLHGNIITTLNNSDLNNYTMLTSLDLSFNVLSEVHNDTFNSVGDLAFLDLSSNRLNFTFTSTQIFSPLTKLKVLNISNNTYLDIPDMILCHLMSLESLTMDGFQSPIGNGCGVMYNLTYLSLSGENGSCKIGNLSEDLLQNVPMLEYLNVSYCKILTVKPEALSFLRNIDTLDISGNTYLNFKGVANATAGLDKSRLRKLFINQMVGKLTICVWVPQSIGLNLQNTSLETLKANDNRIELIHKNVFRLLPNTLKTVSIRNNRLTYGAYIWYLQNLTGLVSLDLSSTRGLLKLPFAEPDNYSRDLSSHHQTDNCLTTPRREIYLGDVLHERSLQHQQNITPFGVPPKLKTLKYTDCKLAYDLSKLYFAENSLRHVDLSYNILALWFGPVYGLENVTHLDLSGNLAMYIKKDFFASFPSLTHLNISHNALEMSDNGQYLRNQSKVEVLDLSHNNILFLNRDFLSGLKSLRTLNLSCNYLDSLFVDLENNVNLTSINCSNNNIKYISPRTRSQMDRIAELHEFTIDLSGNDLRCTCQNIEFLEWLLNSKIQAANKELYHCVDINGKVIHFKGHDVLKNLKASCANFIALSMGLIVTIVLIFSLIVGTICYRYRWKIIYIYYVFKLRLRNNIEYERIYDYDVYVSYTDLDLDFVRKDMIPKLEHQRGTRLYIRDRDSLPGATIAENIIDGIRSSKKTVLLLSQAFLKKKWCRYELHMANMESVSTGRSVMVIIMLEDIPNKDIPPEILYDVQNSRFIDCPNDSSDQELFWANVSAAIDS
ncbi:toll-like receptor 4 [Haliotis rufescens]|uniref:toll-like receptor 4 n=1 Tax=Haliotis rufescens TaxID=6454 RepID=UPI00201EEB68|nr:toll-like receptor 4 [Haliotis rufescens]